MGVGLGSSPTEPIANCRSEYWEGFINGVCCCIALAIIITAIIIIF